MENRAEAIKWLTEHGYFAFARDWAVGKSIGVAKRTVLDDRSGLEVFEPTLVYIFPDLEGGWLLQPPLIPSKEIPFKTLDDAVSRAVEIVDGWEFANSFTPGDWGPLFKLCGVPFKALTADPGRAESS